MQLPKQAQVVIIGSSVAYWNSPLKVAHPLGYISLLHEELRMGGKREKPEDIVLKLRQVEVLQGQGKPLADAVRQIGVTVQTYYRWRKKYDDMS